jgi:signal transduction histidine kinase
VTQQFSILAGGALALVGFTALVIITTRLRMGRIAVEAASQERRRLAREIHDGLAQELAFISMQARGLASRGSDEMLDQLADAAERALGESRELISTRHSQGAASLATAVTETAGRLAERHGARLELDVDPELRVAPDTGRQLMRILREAVSNSLVHGQARVLTVELADRDGVRLRVADDGTGFDPTANRRGDQFGLTSMRERARELGGRLLLRTHPGAGTEVEVVLS